MIGCTLSLPVAVSPAANRVPNICSAENLVQAAIDLVRESIQLTNCATPSPRNNMFRTEYTTNGHHVAPRGEESRDV